MRLGIGNFWTREKIIGNMVISDNVKIGANAVVINSCYDEGAILVGVPERKIEK